jgi:ADP-ribose pyrophosphatase YjhB (NUDIX family)
MSTGAHFTMKLPTKRMAADCLFFDNEGRILVVEPTYKTTWDVPGGVVERDESPRQAAQREIHEELGLDVEPGAMLAVDWLARQGDFTEMVAFLFDGGVLDPGVVRRLELQPDEIRSARFVTLATAKQLLDGEAFARVSAAVNARALRSTAYLENGNPIDGAASR